MSDGERTHRAVTEPAGDDGTLGQRVGREIHALAIKTFTPEEWKAAGN